MTSKTLNKIMLVAALLFCVIFGVSIYIKNERLKRLDDAHDQEWEDKRNQENQSNRDNIDQFNKNNQANNGNNSPTITDKNGQTVDFTNFVSLYGYAESKLNDAPNIQSLATGTAKLSGTGKKGLISSSFSNQTVALSIERAQNSTQTLFKYIAKGNINSSSLTINLNHETSTYTKGNNAWLFYNQTSDEWKTQPNKAYLQEKFGWKTNQTLQLINTSSIKSSNVSPQPNDYMATAELDVSKSSSRASKFLKATYDPYSKTPTPVTYNSCKLTVLFDKNGSFKSIQYEESYNVVIITSNNITLTMTIETNYTETFTHIGQSTVSIDQPSKINA